MIYTYIDIRGPFPILFVGMRAFVLPRAKKNITLDEGMALAEAFK